jgi:hypothetical protein
MSSSREEILREQLNYAITDILGQLSAMKDAFQNPTYNLNKTVESRVDFLLGTVLSGILERYAVYLSNNKIRPTPEEFIRINQVLFSRANEFKEIISKLLAT